MNHAKTLILPLKKVYFDEIKSGIKTEEFRLCTPYWVKRLKNKNFTQIILTLGYPKTEDLSRRLVRPWLGFTQKTIIHPHFGIHPVEVFAIKVN